MTLCDRIELQNKNVFLFAGFRSFEGWRELCGRMEPWAEGAEPVAWVESHELATPGKRLLWHLEHFRCPMEQCQFAGAPLAVPGARAEVSPPVKCVRVCCGHAGRQRGPVRFRIFTESAGWSWQEEAAGSASPDGEIGRFVRWTFAASCIVLALDIKQSLASLSQPKEGAGGIAPGVLRLDSVFSTALRFVQTLAQHCNSQQGQHVYITIAAQGSTTADLRIVCHHTLLTADTADELMARVSAEFDVLRAQLISGSWCRREGCSGPQAENARSNLQHLLVNCLRLLDLLPRHGCPGVTLITDGVVTMHTELSLLDMAANLRRRDIAMQIILMEAPANSYAHIPDPDLLRKLARACTGQLIRCAGDNFLFDLGVLIKRAVLSRRSYLGANADWAETW